MLDLTICISTLLLLLPGVESREVPGVGAMLAVLRILLPNGPVYAGYGALTGMVIVTRLLVSAALDATGKTPRVQVTVTGVPLLTQLFKLSAVPEPSRAVGVPASTRPAGSISVTTVLAAWAGPRLPATSV